MKSNKKEQLECESKCSLKEISIIRNLKIDNNGKLIFKTEKILIKENI